MRVNEIFYSLQGEGYFTGTPAVFIRLSGCNAKCSFCDTEHQSFTELSEEEILQQVLSYPAKHVVITGGEPTLQLTPSLVNKLHSAERFVQIETNGSVALPNNMHIDWITCSPKDLPLRIQHIDELKVLYMQQDLGQYDSIQAKEYRLQPLDSGNSQKNQQNLTRTINYILEHPKWKLSLQTHKILHLQ